MLLTNRAGVSKLSLNTHTVQVFSNAQPSPWYVYLQLLNCSGLQLSHPFPDSHLYENRFATA